MNEKELEQILADIKAETKGLSELADRVERLIERVDSLEADVRFGACM